MAVGLAIVEIGLGVAAACSPRVKDLLASPRGTGAIPMTLPDEHLEQRLNPAFPGHDRRGYRNPVALEHAQIVALGDSQTYGVHVEAGDAWPSQLASLTGRTVYNMGVSGYGPVHSLMLWREAMQLQPKVVIEAFYAGNDLFDSFNLVYNNHQHEELKSPDLQLQSDVRAAEKNQPIKDHVARLLHMGKAEGAAPRARPVPGGDSASLREWFAARSHVYGLLRRVAFEVSSWRSTSGQSEAEDWQDARAFAAAHPEYCQVFEHGKGRTVLTTEYRLAALDQGDPRISEGLSISLQAINRMSQAARTDGVRFVVLMLPTKERVVGDVWTSPTPSFRSLMLNETQAWERAERYFAENDIEYIDALPALQGQWTTAGQPYPVSKDGHPNREGHAAIARAVSDYLGSHGG